MSHAISYTDARANLASILNAVESGREAVVIRRRGHEDVAVIAADELRGLQETAHLLRSPTNAARLLAALERARRGEGERLDLGGLKREAGLGR